MTRNPDKNNDTSVVVNEDKLKIISTQIEKKVNDIEQKLYLINSLFSDIEYCWSDSAADLLRENYHYDKETAENIIYNLKQRKKDLQEIIINYESVEKKNTEKQRKRRTKCFMERENGTSSLRLVRCG